jgi:hypothetical protein
MPLRLVELDRSEFFGWLDEWYLPERPFFQRSQAYELLKRELGRYVRGEVAGRSFLIAGHRGAGKTALVQRAVEDLHREIIREAAGIGRSWPRGALIIGRQRPFLVKLHGASLLSEGQQKEDDALSLVVEVQPALAKPSTETALQQITIALYRAFAREIASAFTFHARQIALLRPKPSHKPDLPELAGQLTLDLDQAPDIAVMRAAWQRLGKMEAGILWPSSYGETLAAGGLKDRGVREILALATANQAFQVCSGKIETSRTTKESANREASVKSESKADAKDIANKLWSLAAGALVGGALLPTVSATAAAGAGLGAALLSTLALTWSSKRMVRSERGLEYSFIIDRSVQTLDRDLPLVIDRIRDVGLAPVFVIDELDKIDAPAECIKAIIDRLKNLTTDYGFFCFLTDRSYYDHIRLKMQNEAFPSEHTYFSHRLLILYRPDELAEFVHRLWSSDTTAGTMDDVSAWVLTALVLHRARLNTVDVMRTIAQLSDDQGRFRPGADRIRSRAEYLVPMAIQLAIEHELRKPELRSRIEDDPAFAQLAIDALYMISRAWEDNKVEVQIDRENMKEYLIKRFRIQGKDED